MNHTFSNRFCFIIYMFDKKNKKCILNKWLYGDTISKMIAIWLMMHTANISLVHLLWLFLFLFWCLIFCYLTCIIKRKFNYNWNIDVCKIQTDGRHFREDWSDLCSRKKMVLLQVLEQSGKPYHEKYQHTKSSIH